MPATDAPVTNLVAGGRHTCALFETGQVKCWGDNGSGQLGLGDMNHRGDEAGEMGDELPPVDLGTNRTAIAIAAGGSHTCAILDDGRIKCWGANARGQLGLGDMAARGDEPCEMGEDLPPVDLGGARAVAVAAGSAHTCALLDDGTVRCWGSNGGGQLGLGDKTSRTLPGAVPFSNGASTTPPRISTLSAGNAHTCAQFDSGRLRCWGDNAAGQLGGGTTGDALTPATQTDVPVGAAFVQLVLGSAHNCVLTDNGRIKCWGLNNFGQLGLGDVENRGDQANEMGEALRTVDLGSHDEGRPLLATELATSGDHACALLETGRVKCWGENAFGGLGLGDVAHRGDQVNEMGNALPEVTLPGLVARP